MDEDSTCEVCGEGTVFCIGSDDIYDYYKCRNQYCEAEFKEEINNAVRPG